jgi:opacity protein-like surface antigen
MNQKTILKSFLLVAAAALGLAASAPADENPATTPPAPAASASSLGLLGQTYGGLSYSRLSLHDSPVNADSYGFEYNQPLNTGFDAVFNYDWTQSGLLAGDRAHEQKLAAALRAFSTSQSWGRPYLEAGVGYDWLRFTGTRDHSFLWIAGGGVEFQTTPDLTITPFVRYERADRYSDKNNVTYGLKANYWVTQQWALTAQVDRNDSQDMGYKIGFNHRF